MKYTKFKNFHEAKGIVLCIEMPHWIDIDL